MTNRPAVAYLVSQYPAISHTFILREVKTLRQMGVDVAVASINRPDRGTVDLTEEERQEASSTYYVKASPVLRVLKAVLRQLVRAPLRLCRSWLYTVRLGRSGFRTFLWHQFYLIEAILVVDWMIRQRLNHLHVHFASQASTVALIASRVHPVGFSMTVHGPDEFYDVVGMHVADKVREARFVSCISKFTASQLMGLSPYGCWHKLYVCSLGVDTEQLLPHCRSQDGPTEILCVGRLVAVKGQTVLMRAVEHVIRERENVLLRLVGDGPMVEPLRGLAAQLGLTSQVIFEGALNQDQLIACFRSADIFALASFAEGIPVVLMEAMAQEIPCVTTRITGIPELIRDGVDGLLVTAGDEEELADALLRLVRDPSLRERLGKGGRRRVLEKYDLAKNTRRFGELLRTQLQSHAARCG